jgi:hypothetical protein
MSTFITLDGVIVVAKTVGEWPILPKGHSWRNNEPLGESPIWREVPYPVESVDPNHQTLFGYEVKEFMAKQYR